MKKIFFFWVLLLIQSCIDKKDINVIILSKTGSDPTEVHASANNFAEAVGRKLKAFYPSKIVKVDAELSINNHDVSEDLATYTIIWYAKIEACDSLEADYYFDRRGTLLPGASKDDAMEAVDKEMITSHKVLHMTKQFKLLYGNYRQPYDFTSISFDHVTYSGGRKRFWCLWENFCTARKN